MPLPLRRLLNRLPLLPSGNGDLYVRSTWHKPTPYDQWKSQAPWRPMMTLRTDHFGRSLRRQRLLRVTLRGGILFVIGWLIWESARGLQLF